MIKRLVKKTFKYQASTQFMIITLGILLLLLGAFCSRFIFQTQPVFLADNVSQMKGSFHFNTQAGKYLLRSGIPFLDITAGEDDPFTVLQINWVEVYWYLVAHIRNTTPLEILRTQLPLLALMRPKPLPIKVLPKLPKVEPPETKPLQIPKSPNIPNDLVPKPTNEPSANEPLVFIYHTHTSESYIPESGKDHLLNQKGDVVKAGSYLQKVLKEKYNIQCAHSETIHDQVPFRDSYKRSQVTLINYLKAHKKLKS